MTLRRLLFWGGAALGTFWASAATTFIVGTKIESNRRRRAST